jgi:hypothetical protein
MADNVLETAQPDVQVQQPAVQPDYSAELKQQMELSLNGGIIPAAQGATEGDLAPIGNEGGGTTTDPIVATPDHFTPWKEKFGYENQEAAWKEIEELRAFKATPRTPEFTVSDDASGRLLKALAAGKTDEVYNYLHGEMQINRLLAAEVNKDTAPDIVKLGMQLKYKDLTPDEINYKFNKQFAMPSKPVQGVDEEQGEYELRVNEWQNVVTDKQMELMIEAKLAKPELQNSKSNFVFPEIETPIDEGYVQYQKMLEEKPKQDEATRAAYKALTSKAIETKLNFKDEANKIEFGFQFEPDAEGFAKAVDIACDADLFWQTFTNSDGTPNRQKFLDAIYYANNKEKVLTAAMIQAKNAAIKAGLPDNSQGGMVRQITPNQEPSEVDKLMRESLRGYGGY